MTKIINILLATALVIGSLAVVFVGLGADAVASSTAAERGDLLIPAECLGQTWPNISAECLVTEDGSPAEQVRTVTIGYEEGEGTTVLVRMPAPELAAN